MEKKQVLIDSIKLICEQDSDINFQDHYDPEGVFEITRKEPSKDKIFYKFDRNTYVTLATKKDFMENYVIYRNEYKMTRKEAYNKTKEIYEQVYKRLCEYDQGYWYFVFMGIEIKFCLSDYEGFLNTEKNIVGGYESDSSKEEMIEIIKELYIETLFQIQEKYEVENAEYIKENINEIIDKLRDNTNKYVKILKGNI